MKRILSASLVFALIFGTAHATERKCSVDELKATLVDLQRQHKTDEDVATALKQIVLTEQLVPATMNALATYLPGHMSIEQIYILEGRSAFSPEPATVTILPAALDAAAQQTLLTKANALITQMYLQTPLLTAAKNTVRFQDGIEDTHLNDSNASSGIGTGPTSRYLETSRGFMRLVTQHTENVSYESGVEVTAQPKRAPQWGANGQLSEGGPHTILKPLMSEVFASGKLNWARWESVHEKPLAVYAFAIDKKKSHYKVEYCCFPNSDSYGSVHNGVQDTLGSITSWVPFRGTVGYHGEIYVEPQSGAVLRVVLHAEFKPTDFLHQEDTRIDFAPVTIEGKTWFTPSRTFLINESVPFGDNATRRFTIRHTLFTMTYKDYQTTSGTHSGGN